LAGGDDAAAGGRGEDSDGRREEAAGARRLGRLLWQRLATVAWRHGRKAVLEDKGRWWPGREGSSEEWQATANRWGAMGGGKDRRRRWRKAATAFRCGRGQRQRARRRGTKVAGGGRGGRGKKRQRAWLRSGRGGVWLRLWLRRRGQRRCETATVGGRKRAATVRRGLRQREREEVVASA
ncbi:hypothetical protein B296_00025684, partial [Ensete ventricosum]